MMAKREICIDILKFLAVICVINSHMDVCYPSQWKLFATGGAIGDALFFFCSGYTLFLGRMDGFVVWYERRLWRILPAAGLCSIAFASWCGASWWRFVGGYWFIQCILIYYIFLYMIRKWMQARIGTVFAVVFGAIGIWFFCFYDQTKSIYGGGYFMWLHYFVPMLLGALLGMRKVGTVVHGFRWLMIFVLSTVLYYLCAYFTFLRTELNIGQLVSLPFLWLVIVSLFMAVKCEVVEKLFARSSIQIVVLTVGGLCLEVYLTHQIFMTPALNGVFPLNIPLLFVAILVVAYLTRSVSRVIAQTLQWKGGYDWHSIVKVC